MGRLENEINIIPGAADTRPTSFFLYVSLSLILFCVNFLKFRLLKGTGLKAEEIS